MNNNETTVETTTSSLSFGNNHVVRSPLLSDYLHLYIGCKIYSADSVGYLTGVTNGGTECEIQFILEDGINVDEEPCFNPVSDVKPILRPLSSMTKEEFESFKSIADNDFSKMTVIDAASKDGCFTRLAHELHSSAFLLSKHFDLFGLIEAGLAIEAVSKR